MRHHPATQPSPLPNVLRAYFVLLYSAIFVMIAQFWDFAGADPLLIKTYTALATAAYAALYTLIPASLTVLALWLLRRGRNPARWRTTTIYLTAYLSSTLLLLCLYADYRLYELYDYHFNGFVWNLLTTPGGIAALGATASTTRAIALQIGLFFVGTALCLWFLQRHLQKQTLFHGRLMRAATGVLMLLLVSEEGVYAYSVYTGQEEYLQASQAIPFHLHTSLTTVFKHLGIKRTARSKLRIAGGEVDYPAKNLVATPLQSNPNIIMLVGESFRWDLLDPAITPNLWAFAQQSARFENHYSGGNRTRMGLFSMFYGIYAPYWYSFERQRVAPALMEFITARNYQLALHTSQSFDYPELRHTVFTGIPEQFMQELKNGEPWKRDQQNISDIIGKLEQRDRQRPFFGFMFFESTHAPYDFPETAVIRPDYQQDLNYINMNLKENIESIHARYINAAHHIDAEAGRLLAYLQQTGMLDNTIVMFTGDHGEEFMEKGHWGHGHGSTFPEEQIRVPLVLHLPGRKAEVIRQRTSHLEIAPTLLAQLGVQQDSHSYSSAGDLFSPPPPYFVAGEYDYLSIFDDQYKITFPFTGSSYFHYTVTHANDHPVTKETKQRVIDQYQSRIDEVVKESQRFIKSSG